MYIDSTQDLTKELAKRRKALGISQLQLSQLCNLSVNGISKFEASDGDREIKLSTLLKISKILGIRLKLEFEK